MVLAGCKLIPLVTYDGTSTAVVTQSILTPDGQDGYAFTSDSGRMQVASLEGNTAGNLRAVFWPADSPPATE